MKPERKAELRALHAALTRATPVTALGWANSCAVALPEALDALDAAERRATAYEARAGKLEIDLAAAREESAAMRSLLFKAVQALPPRPNCRDCADHDGTCQSEGKEPCDPVHALPIHIAKLTVERAAMRPVVEAAQCFRGLYRERNYEPSDFWELEGRLRAAVDAYEAAKGGGS